MPSPYTRKQRLILTIVPPITAGIVRLLCATLRYEDVVAPGVLTGYDQKPPQIYAFWHRSLLVCSHRFRNWGIAILISRSFDGELIARIVELLGFTAIRGSSSRGGAIALRQMAEAYNEGHWCAFTADGPRGPAQVAKPGPIQLAQLVGAAEVGVFHVLPERAWILKTWDQFLIPKPFSTVKIAWPGPTAELSLESLQRQMDLAVTMAEQSLSPHP